MYFCIRNAALGNLKELSLRSFAISLPKFWFERGKFDLTKRDGKAFLTTGQEQKVTMFANANAMTTVGRRSLEALRLQPLGKPPQCFS